MSSWTAVAGSWGLLAGCIVLGWYYYTKNGNQPKRIGKQLVNGSIPEVLDETIQGDSTKKQKRNKKEQKRNASGSMVSGASLPELESISSHTSAQPSLQKFKQTNSDRSTPSLSFDVKSNIKKTTQKDSDLDVNEFARQMAKAKAGTTFSGSKKDNQHVRTRKQSKVNGSIGPGLSDREVLDSGTSSNTGGDADDDLSSVNSPELSAITSPADTTGISDMLEPAGRGPISLRITEPLMPVKSRTIQPKKQEVAETKKQRQNRLKREREKEANREAEAQRKILEEKQRRTAREAEGRPAKNGNGWTYDSGLPANVWSSGKSKPQTAPVMKGDLLDTTEEPEKPPTVINKAHSLSTEKLNSAEGISAHWGNNLPSEEEQLRLIQEQSEESEWTTVPQPKRSKRKDQTET